MYVVGVGCFIAKLFSISLQPVAAVSIMHKRGESRYSVKVGESQFLEGDLCFPAIQQKMINILACE